jgi:hypothetical protein
MSVDKFIYKQASTLVVTFFYLECTDPQPLGIENGHILDSQLYASALTETNDGPQIGRLNMLSAG